MGGPYNGGGVGINMALITIQEAAERLGISLETVETWVQMGLLRVTLKTPSVPEGALGILVEEDELQRVAESMGWFILAAERWDDDGA